MARSALEEARDLRELAGDLLDHGHGCGADGLHGERGEPVGDHGSHEEHGKGDGAEHIETAGGGEQLGRIRASLRLGHRHAGDEATEESEGDESGRADGEALANSGGGVAGGVEGVGLVAHLRGELRHLGNAASVVAHWSVHVNGQAGGKRAEEAEGSEGDAVHAALGERDESDDGDDGDGDDGGLVAEGKAVDDVGRRASLARLRHLAHGSVRVRRVILSDETDNAAAKEAGHDAGPRRQGAGLDVADEEGLGEEEDGEGVGDAAHEDGGHAELDLENRLDVLLLLHGGDVSGEEGRDGADDHAHRGDSEGEEDGAPTR
mmetsp:Transcript_7225/g.19662  ORF Transcript_7225/g.19662 Transcript_7225/m.19662 type:complete len:320 (+) Transcript_7225:651-1610(+)